MQPSAGEVLRTTSPRWSGVERGAWSVGREAWGVRRTVARGTVGTIHVSRVPKSGPPLPLLALFCGPDGVKRPEMGSKWRLLGESATWLITAQLLFKYAIRSRVASDESLERNGRKSHFYIKLRRKPSSPNFCRKPENVALCSILTPAGWECCTRLGARHRRRTLTVGRGTWEVKRVRAASE